MRPHNEQQHTSAGDEATKDSRGRKPDDSSGLPASGTRNTEPHKERGERGGVGQKEAEHPSRWQHVNNACTDDIMLHSQQNETY